MKDEKKVTEKDIIGLIKKKLPYSSVKIKKKDLKDLNGNDSS